MQAKEVSIYFGHSTFLHMICPVEMANRLVSGGIHLVPVDYQMNDGYDGTVYVNPEFIQMVDVMDVPDVDNLDIHEDDIHMIKKLLKQNKAFILVLGADPDKKEPHMKGE